MTLGEFRDCHSELIEQFQWIEFNFKRIITNLTGKNILAGLEELKNESWGPLSIKVKQAESEYGITFIPDDVYDELKVFLRVYLVGSGEEAPVVSAVTIEQ